MKSNTPIDLRNHIVKHKDLVAKFLGVYNAINNAAFLIIDNSPDPLITGQIITIVGAAGGGFDVALALFETLKANGRVKARIANFVRGPWTNVSFGYSDFFYPQTKKRLWGLFFKFKRGSRTRSPKRDRLCIRVPHR